MFKKVIALSLSVITAVSIMGCGVGSKTETSSVDTSVAAEVETEKVSVPQTTLSVEGNKVTISLFAASIPQNTATGSALELMAEYINAN